MSVKWHKLGEYIEECDERKDSGDELSVLGLNKDKEFMPTAANVARFVPRSYRRSQGRRK